MVMRIRQKVIATLLGAVVAAAIGTAPVAAADPDAQQPDQPQQSCEQQGATYRCDAPDDAQLNDPPSADHYYSIFG